MSEGYNMGDHWVIDDTTGQKVRASRTQQQWDGAIVNTKNFDPRHPQDLVRMIRDDQSVQLPRPRAVDSFVGPLDTTLLTAAAAGATALSVTSSVRMAVNDVLSVTLANGDMFRTTITTINSLILIQVLPALPFAASAGAVIYDNTAMALSDITP